MVNTESPQRIDELGDDFFADPHVYYARWRETGPVVRVRMPRNGVPAWVVIGYEEARAALADHRLLKGVAGMREVFERKNTQQFFANPGSFDLSVHMLNSDPPDHTRLRKLVNKAFTARAVNALRPRIQEITDALLDAMEGSDEVDLLQAFAVPLPVTVICELLGVPFEDRERFQRWTKLLLGGAEATEEEVGTAAADMSLYLRDLVEGKRAEPGEDLLSGLVLASDEDDRLSEQELVSMAFLLLVAGHETTVNLIANGTRALLFNPAQLRALREDPSSTPAAVEEFLRHDGPVGWSTFRYTGEPVRIAGIDIPEGEFVLVALGAANRDPARFADPENLDLAGETAGHLAFGHGIHYCVGAPLARLEADIAFRGLVQRFPDMSMTPEAATVAWQPSTLIHGMTEFPVRLR
ncbi:cytochrome P450 [Nocardia sp. GAS34]|uniref:cytochrome P450 family protein n=1 Tax=unclassified Nocardia TaxID=2637762 RepID=UPI003D1EEF09